MILYAVLVNPQPRCIQLRALHGLSIPILTHTQSLRQGPPAPGTSPCPSHCSGWASLPPSLLPSLRSVLGSASRAQQCGNAPGVWGGWHNPPVLWECPGRVAQPPCPATAVWECPRSVAQPPHPAATEASWTLRSQPWMAAALCALELWFEATCWARLGLVSWWVLVGFAQGSVP